MITWKKIVNKKAIFYYGLGFICAILIAVVFFIFNPFKHYLAFKHYLYFSKKTNLSLNDVTRYTVQVNDNLWNISQQYGLEIDTLISINRLKNFHFIKEKTDILIPEIDGIFVEKNKLDNIPEHIVDISQRFFQLSNDVISGNISNKIFIIYEIFSLKDRASQLGMEFFSPLKEYYITGSWGFRIHPISKKRSLHKGIDLGGRIGTPVYACAKGRVTFAGTSRGYGKLVVLKHSRGYTSWYAHLNFINVKVGQVILSQVQIGTLGRTGNVTGPHLHFEIRKNNKSLDPRTITDFHKAKYKKRK